MRWPKLKLKKLPWKTTLGVGGVIYAKNKFDKHTQQRVGCYLDDIKLPSADAPDDIHSHVMHMIEYARKTPSLAEEIRNETKIDVHTEPNTIEQADLTRFLVKHFPHISMEPWPICEQCPHRFNRSGVVCYPTASTDTTTSFLSTIGAPPIATTIKRSFIFIILCIIIIIISRVLYKSFVEASLQHQSSSSKR